MTARQDLQREVTCSLCLDVLQDPKLLSCDHIFCKSPCLENLARRSENNSLSCPECRAITVVPGNLSNLRTACHINRLKDIIKRLEESEIKEKAGRETSRPPLAVESRSESKSKSKSSPQAKLPHTKPDSATNYCDQHTGQRLDLYCHQCKQLICHKCVGVGRNHYQHSYELATKVTQYYKRLVIDQLSSVEKIRRDVEQALEAAAQTRRGICSEKSSVNRNVTRSFTSGQVSEARVRSCLSLTNKTVAVRLQTIQCHEERLQLVWSELDDLVISVHQSAFEKGDEEFLRSVADLSVHMKKLSSKYLGISKLPVKFPYAASLINEKYGVLNGGRPPLNSVYLLKLTPSNRDYSLVSRTFRESWCPRKGHCPEITSVFAVVNTGTEQTFIQYIADLRKRRAPTHVEQYLHGTTLSCDIMHSEVPCVSDKCGVCGIVCRGFDERLIASNIPTWMRFGMGIYLASNSSKCHEYTRGAHGLRAMLWCDVVPGNKQVIAPPDDFKFSHMTQPSRGYDCVYGHQGCLNYDEIVFYNRRAIMPRYVIVYEKDGIEQIATNRTVTGAAGECPGREECPGRVKAEECPGRISS